MPSILFYLFCHNLTLAAGSVVVYENICQKGPKLRLQLVYDYLSSLFFFSLAPFHQIPKDPFLPLLVTRIHLKNSRMISSKGKRFINPTLTGWCDNQPERIHRRVDIKKTTQHIFLGLLAKIKWPLHIFLGQWPAYLFLSVEYLIRWSLAHFLWY